MAGRLPDAKRAERALPEGVDLRGFNLRGADPLGRSASGRRQSVQQWRPRAPHFLETSPPPLKPCTYVYIYIENNGHAFVHIGETVGVCMIIQQNNRILVCERP